MYLRTIAFIFLMSGPALASPAYAGPPGPAPELSAEVSDAIVVASLRVALLDALGTDGLRIETTVEDGAVYLSGEVVDRSSRELAPSIADQIEGVVLVESDLTLMSQPGDGMSPDDTMSEGSSAVADALLAARVKSTLLVKTGASSMDVHVDVADGVVLLTSQVEHRSLQKSIRRTVESVEGVESVQDNSIVVPH